MAYAETTLPAFTDRTDLSHCTVHFIHKKHSFILYLHLIWIFIQQQCSQLCKHECRLYQQTCIYWLVHIYHIGCVGIIIGWYNSHLCLCQGLCVCSTSYNSVHVQHCYQSSFPSLKFYVIHSTQPMKWLLYLILETY